MHNYHDIRRRRFFFWRVFAEGEIFWYGVGVRNALLPRGSVISCTVPTSPVPEPLKIFEKMEKTGKSEKSLSKKFVELLKNLVGNARSLTLVEESTAVGLIQWSVGVEHYSSST